ncbi:hypothetical protein ACFPH9_13330 [Brevundimonas bullata]|uniref:hypothetical protein n=1 Tax=Brevundimonas bullata TaxID=13160 RepID=UPI002E0EC5ED
MTTPAASVDLTNCDREPIHIPGAIQPIGFLVALTRWRASPRTSGISSISRRRPWLEL